MLEFFFITLAFLLSFPVLVLFVQIAVASISPGTNSEETTGQSPRFVVLIPAHNEERVIREAINSIKLQLSNAGSILVVADNCVDNTAQLVREAGVMVIEREDIDDRGKGYALDYGLNYINNSDLAPEVVVIVDADSIVEKGSIDKLVDKCVQVDRPVQAQYIMRSNSGSPGQKIAEFAWIVKNLVRPLGYFKMGMPCQLMGTGMAIPLNLLREVDLAGSNIVEDMKLGIDLAQMGYSPVFCPEASVISVFPEEENSVKSQRTRWEHGHLGTIFSEFSGLLKAAIRKKDLSLLAMGLDLMVPPLAFLAIILFSAFSITVLVSLFSNISNLSFLIMLFTCSLFFISVLLAWFRFARHVISVRELMTIPVYIIRKIPMYIRFWTGRQKDWVRTGRD